jgi:tRNA dimethylallyltransferase
LSKKRRKAIFVIGPTATGKTSLGVFLAKKLESEVISIDSRQVYRGLDLGTGKDLADFGVGLNAVPYHLIDVVDPKEDSYSIYRFVTDAVEAMESIWSQGKIPILVGGSSLYINALINRYALDGCEPNHELRAKLEKLSTGELFERLRKYPLVFGRTDTSTRNRLIRGLEVAESVEENTPVEIPEFEYLLLAPYFHRKVCHQRIEQRLNERFDEGMIQEVKELFESGVSWEKLDWLGLEYRFIANYLKGEMSEQEMRERLLI